ncbi:MAG: hypothetical protein SFX18_11520 [Pirellulales bacterium]|nr:hypothetical protein [Pirellulales bacterium]
MPQSDFHTGGSLLAHALENLQVKWQVCQETWRDAAAARYAEEHLAALPLKIQTFLDTTQRLAVLLQRAEQDCQ